jgi:acetyl-CoA/propionyl-CoA carboxylase biotin carboxyl carrier protein
VFDTVLVANRGEIAVRIMRTLRGLGVRSVAVYSDADADARHVAEADIAVRIGPAGASRSYLDIEKILEAAKRTAAQAIHPGYGFLAENADFARACEAAGVVFVGPPATAIAAMGDKIRAKALVAAAGVPVVPGLGAAGMTDAEVAAAAREVGFPVLLKPSAGGGGKGMRLVRSPDESATAIASARREAQGSFGDDTLLVERFIERPRHIEIQIMADGRGHVLHLGERECSLQRRHQKIVEEAPSTLITPSRRAAMGLSAVEAARAVGYTGAGTVEFIVGAERPDDFYFMEMNTRLQVEHPVTELVTGLDLVELQLRVAAGEPLPLAQDDVRVSGHAIEARLYAEDPAHGFLPSAGRLLRVREAAGPHVRIDSGIDSGMTVGTDYDPMLAKIVAWAPDRRVALQRLDRALSDTVVLGVQTNAAFLRALLADDDVVAGRLDTELVERRIDDLVEDRYDDRVLVAAALVRLAAMQPTGPVLDPFDATSGWRLGSPAWASWAMRVGGHPPVEVRVRGTTDDAQVAVGDGPVEPARAVASAGGLTLTYRDDTTSFAFAEDGETTWLAREGATWLIREQERLAAARHDDGGAVSGSVLAPMPGTVTVVHAAVGDRVALGQPLLAVEAMKMEHALTAPIAGVLTELSANAGQSVVMDQVLAVVTPPGEGQ